MSDAARTAFKAIRRKRALPQVHTVAVVFAFARRGPHVCAYCWLAAAAITKGSGPESQPHGAKKIKEEPLPDETCGRAARDCINGFVESLILSSLGPPNTVVVGCVVVVVERCGLHNLAAFILGCRVTISTK